MANLLKYELRKLSRSKSFYICLGLQAVYIYLQSLLAHTVIKAARDLLVSSYTATGNMVTAASGGITTILLGIFVAIFICEDYSCGTLKNIYAKGYSRVKVSLSKFIIVCLYAVMLCVISWLSGIIFGIIFFDTGSVSGMDIASMLSQVVTVLGYAAFFFAWCILIKKTGGSVAVCILVPMLLSLILSIADAFIEANFALSDYWLDGLFTGSDPTGTEVALGMGISAIYCVVFTAAGVFLSTRNEV